MTAAAAVLLVFVVMRPEAKLVERIVEVPVPAHASGVKTVPAAKTAAARDLADAPSRQTATRDKTARLQWPWDDFPPRTRSRPQAGQGVLSASDFGPHGELPVSDFIPGGDLLASAQGGRPAAASGGSGLQSAASSPTCRDLLKDLLNSPEGRGIVRQ